MSDLALADPIAAYFRADTQAPEHVARCFTLRGVVYDRGHTYTGRAAIAEWKAESSAFHASATVPFAAALIDGVHVVYCHMAGNFPGFHCTLRLSFRLERGLIASLEITG